MGRQDDAAVTCAAYRVTENGQTWYFTTSPGEELMDAAQTGYSKFCVGFFIDLIAENLLISPHKCLRHHEKMA